MATLRERAGDRNAVDQFRSMRRPGGCVAVILIVVMGACSGDGGGQSGPSADTVSGDDEALAELVDASANGDPAAVELPAPDDESAVVAWLVGDGASAVGLLTSSDLLWQEGRRVCDDVAESLDDVGSPETMLAAASATPDPVTSDVLVGLYATVERVLGLCPDDSGSSFDSALADFAWQWALADRRLDELGVER